MKNPKFLNVVNYDYNAKTAFEKPSNKPSKTIEGESFTIQEIFRRYNMGQAVNVDREAYYEDTQNFDSIDFQRLRYADPFEKQELLLQVQEKAKKAMDAIEKWKKEKYHDSPLPDDEARQELKPQKPKEAKAGSSGEPASKRSGTSAANSDEPNES